MYSKDYYESADYNPEVIGIEIFKKMSQYMPYMVFITRAPDFKLLYANRKVSEFIGLDLKDLREMDGHLLSMMEPDDITRMLETGQKIHFINDDQAIKLTVRLNTKEGGTVYLETSVSVFRRNPDGTPAEYFCVSENITAKVKLEERARELELITHSAEETFRYGAWEWFPKNDNVIWSNGIYDIFEIDPDQEDFPINRYVQMIHPEDLDKFNAVIDKALRDTSGFALEYRVISTGNNISYLREQGKPILDQNGQVIKYIGTIWDVSDYWETLNNLHKYEATLQEAEKNLQLGTWEWDIAQNKVKWSDGFWKLLEYPEELRNYQWMPMEQYYRHVPPEMASSVVGPDADFEKYSEVVAREPQEVTLLTYTGKTVHVVSHTRIIEWRDGKPAIAVGSTADVTTMKSIQKNLEAKVAELAKAYDEVEQFSYVASHDLQEPLRKITAFSERLKVKCGDQLNSEGALFLDRIIDGTSRMRTLIENLLTLSRTKRNADYFKTTDLNEIISEVLMDMEPKIAEKQAVVQVGDLPEITAIPTQMHQLFQNLLANSLKFTKENQEPVIHIKHDHLTKKQKDEYNLDPKMDYIHISVQDNGIGFDSEFADVIFSPFKRLHGRSEYEGTGIGLAICKKVAQNHSGLIWATSAPGNGATFHIVLAIKPTVDLPER